MGRAQKGKGGVAQGHSLDVLQVGENEALGNMGRDGV